MPDLLFGMLFLISFFALGKCGVAYQAQLRRSSAPAGLISSGRPVLDCCGRRVVFEREGSAPALGGRHQRRAHRGISKHFLDASWLGLRSALLACLAMEETRASVKRRRRAQRSPEFSWNARSQAHRAYGCSVAASPRVLVRTRSWELRRRRRPPSAPHTLFGARKSLRASVRALSSQLNRTRVERVMGGSNAFPRRVRRVRCRARVSPLGRDARESVRARLLFVSQG
jgi:hypothetical protein